MVQERKGKRKNKKKRIKRAKKRVEKKEEESEKFLKERLKNITGEEADSIKIREENILKNPEPIMAKGRIDPKKMDRAITEIRKKGVEEKEEIEKICEKHGIDPKKVVRVPPTALGLTDTKKKEAKWEISEFLEKVKERKTQKGGYTEKGRYIYINPEKSEKTKEIAKMHEGIHQALKGKKLPHKVEEAMASYLTSITRIRKGESKKEVIEDLERRTKLRQGDANRRGMEAAKKMLEEYKPKEAEETFQKIMKGEASDPQRRLRRIIEDKELVKGKGVSPVRRIEEKTEEKKGLLGQIKEKLFG